MSTAYAINSSQIDVETDFESHTSEQVVEEQSSSNESESSDNSGSFESRRDSESNIVTPLKPAVPKEPFPTNQPDEETASEEIVDPIAEYSEDEHIVVEGSEQTNRGDVRIRIRDRSDSELNGDDIDGGNSEFKLEIRESTSVD